MPAPLPRRPRTRTVSVLAAPAALVVALLLGGCGGDDGGGSGSSPSDDASGSAPSAADAPLDASVDDFCAALTTADGVSAEDGTDAQTEAAHAAGKQMIETGTPSDMPKEARKGFEVYADAIVDVTPAQVEKISSGNDADAFEALGIDSDGQTAVRAMVAYAGTTCVAAIPSPSISPSEPDAS